MYVISLLYTCMSKMLMLLTVFKTQIDSPLSVLILLCEQNYTTTLDTEFNLMTSLPKQWIVSTLSTWVITFSLFKGLAFHSFLSEIVTTPFFHSKTIVLHLTPCESGISLSFELNFTLWHLEGKLFSTTFLLQREQESKSSILNIVVRKFQLWNLCLCTHYGKTSTHHPQTLCIDGSLVMSRDMSLATNGFRDCCGVIGLTD